MAQEDLIVIGPDNRQIPASQVQVLVTGTTQPVSLGDALQNSGGGAVSSVSSSDSNIVIDPTTGDVVVTLSSELTNIDIISGRTDGSDLSILTPNGSGTRAGNIQIIGGDADTGFGAGSISISAGNSPDANGAEIDITSGASGDNAGSHINIIGAIPGSTGDIQIVTGPGATDADTGAIILSTAAATGVGESGGVQIAIGNSVDSAAGAIAITSGSATGSGNAGNIIIEAGDAAVGNTGTIEFLAGVFNKNNNGASMSIDGGAETHGGTVTIATGLANAGGSDGGDMQIILNAGNAGRNGQFIIENLPTADPLVSGAFFTTAGVVHQSP